MDYTAKLLSEFPGATEFKAEDLLFAFQDGQSRKLAGAVLQAFCRAAVNELVKRAETAAGDAEAAKNAIVTLKVESSTLETGEAATVTAELKDGKYVITFGLPKGATGDKGASIASIERTEGNGASGTTDTYTVTLTDGSKTTFQVSNGKDGTVTFESLTAEQKAELQGEKGDPFTYDDFTAEQLAALKGKDGDTPVLGKDYFTETDKKEIVDDTIAALEESGFSGGGMQMDLLWENASPTSQFAAQTVELDLSGYTHILVGFTDNTAGGGRRDFGLTENAVDGLAWGQAYGSSKWTRRGATIVDSGVAFSTGKVVDTYGGSSTDNNSLVIPISIYGIKGVVA